MPWRHGPESRDNLRVTFHSGFPAIISCSQASWSASITHFDLKLELRGTWKDLLYPCFRATATWRESEGVSRPMEKLWSLVWRQKPQGVTEQRYALMSWVFKIIHLFSKHLLSPHCVHGERTTILKIIVKLRIWSLANRLLISEWLGVSVPIIVKKYDYSYETA